MKNQFLAFLLLNAFLVASCSQSTTDGVKPNDAEPGCTDPLAENYKASAKLDDCSCTYTMSSSVSKTVPSAITTKVLIEQMTGTWCGWCVDGTLRLNNLLTAYPNKVVGAIIHQGDAMQNLSIYNSINSTYRVDGFPSGMVNRKPSSSSGDIVMDRGEWSNNVTSALAQPVSMGLGIDASISGNILNVMLHVANKTETTESYSVVAYLLEDGLVYSQKNYYSNLAGASTHPFYSQPATITNYVHNKVVRKMITDDAGIGLPAAAKGANKIYKRMFTTDLENYNKSKLRIVAFVLKQGGTKPEVVNVQELVLNANTGAKDFD